MFLSIFRTYQYTKDTSFPVPRPLPLPTRLLVLPHPPPLCPPAHWRPREKERESDPSRETPPVFASRPAPKPTDDILHQQPNLRKNNTTSRLEGWLHPPIFCRDSSDRPILPLCQPTPSPSGAEPPVSIHTHTSLLNFVPISYLPTSLPITLALSLSSRRILSIPYLAPTTSPTYHLRDIEVITTERARESAYIIPKRSSRSSRAVLELSSSFKAHPFPLQPKNNQHQHNT